MSVAKGTRVIVEPDDFERGMLLTVYSGELQPSRYYDDYGVSHFKHEACCELKGVPLKVQAVSLPYVIVRTADAQQSKVIIDSRTVKFSRVSLDYVQALNAPRPADGARGSSL